MMVQGLGKRVEGSPIRTGIGTGSGRRWGWREQVLPELVCRSAKPMQELRLSPTTRSQFR